MAVFMIERTGIPMKSAAEVAQGSAQGEWSNLTVVSRSGTAQYSMIERRGGYVYLRAGVYGTRPWLFSSLLKYTPNWFMKAHAANSIQPLISSVECNLNDAFVSADSGDDSRGIRPVGPDPDRKRGNILVHGVGGVGGLEGCLAPGTKTGAGLFGGSWEAMHFLMNIVEREPVVLRVLNNPKVA